MENITQTKITNFLKGVSNMSAVKAIGWTGKISVPKAGESDIDIFVFVDAIPSVTERNFAYVKMKELFGDIKLSIFDNAEWGTGDFFTFDGIETELMYFTTEETVKYADEVLDCKHLDSVNGFYPTGRLATLKNMSVIYDEFDFLKTMQDKLSVFPDKLRIDLFEFHSGKMYDAEDFGRALTRKDVVFYHQVLEHALDHFLQAVYALNKTYFPSRKRTQKYLNNFEIAPKNCYQRIAKVLKFGCATNGIAKSQKLWFALVSELLSCGKM